MQAGQARNAGCLGGCVLLRQGCQVGINREQAARLCAGCWNSKADQHVSDVLQQLLVTLRQQLVSKGAAGNVH